MSDPPEVNKEKANSPLLKAEAYLFLSKLRRISLHISSACILIGMDDKESALKLLQDASLIFDEFDKELDDMIFDPIATDE